MRHATNDEFHEEPLLPLHPTRDGDAATKTAAPRHMSGDPSEQMRHQYGHHPSSSSSYAPPHNSTNNNGMADATAGAAPTAASGGAKHHHGSLAQRMGSFVVATVPNVAHSVSNRIPLICDLIHGNVRSTLVMSLTFAFIILGAMTLFVLLLAPSATTGSQMSFIISPGTSSEFGVPMPDIVVQYQTADGDAMAGKVVTASFSLIEKAMLKSSVLFDVIPNFFLDCAGDATWNQRSYLCSTVNIPGAVSQGVMTTDRFGMARFSGLALNFGIPAKYRLAISGDDGTAITYDMDFRATVNSLTMLAPVLGPIQIGVPVPINFFINITANQTAIVGDMLVAVIPVRYPQIAQTKPNGVMAGYVPNPSVFADDEVFINAGTMFANLPYIAAPTNASAAPPTIGVICQGVAGGLQNCAGNIAMNVTIDGASNAFGGFGLFLFGRLVPVTYTSAKGSYPKRLIKPVAISTTVSSLAFLRDENDTAPVPYRLEDIKSMTEGTPRTLYAKARDATGLPVPGVVVFFRAFGCDVTPFDRGFTTKYLPFNMSTYTDDRGVAVLDSIALFSAYGRTGNYTIVATVGPVSVESAAIEVTSSVLEQEESEGVGLITLNSTLGILSPSAFTFFVFANVPGTTEESLKRPFPGKRIQLQPANDSSPFHIVSNAYLAKSDIKGAVYFPYISALIKYNKNATTTPPSSISLGPQLVEAVADGFVVNRFLLNVGPASGSRKSRTTDCRAIEAELLPSALGEGQPWPSNNISFAVAGMSLATAGNLSVIINRNVQPSNTLFLSENDEGNAVLSIALTYLPSLATSPTQPLYVRIGIFDGRCQGLFDTSIALFDVASAEDTGSVTIVPVISAVSDVALTTPPTFQLSKGGWQFGYSVMTPPMDPLASGAPRSLSLFAASVPSVAEYYSEVPSVLVTQGPQLQCTTVTTNVVWYTLQCTLSTAAFEFGTGTYTFVPVVDGLFFWAANTSITVTASTLLPQAKSCSLSAQFVHVNELDIYYTVQIMLNWNGSAPPQLAPVPIVATLKKVSNGVATTYDMWSNTADMQFAALAELDPATNTARPPAIFVTAAPSNFTFLELSGLPGLPNDLWYVVFAVPGTSISTSILFNNTQCQCYNIAPNQDAVGKWLNFPTTVVAGGIMTFQLRSPVDIWRSGFVGFPECQDAVTLLQTRCLWTDDDLYTFPSHFFVSSVDPATQLQTLTITNFYFPPEVSQQHVYNIVMHLPGLPPFKLLEVYIGKTGCNARVLTTMPPLVSVATPFAFEAAFSCGSVPLANAELEISIVSSDLACVATACGAVPVPRNVLQTASDGVAAAITAVTAGDPTANYTLQIGLLSWGSAVGEAANEASMVLGLAGHPVTTQSAVAAVDLVFQRALSGLVTLPGILSSSLSFGLTNFVGTVNIVRPPASIESAKFEGEPLNFTEFPVVQVVFGDGQAHGEQLVTFLVYDALDQAASLPIPGVIVLADGGNQAFTNATGFVEFVGLRFQNGPPGTFAMRFFARGIMSPLSAPFTVEGPEVLTVAEAKEQSEKLSLVFLALTAPLLYANVPRSPTFVVGFALLICLAFIAATPIMYQAANGYKSAKFLIFHISLCSAIIVALAACFALLFVMRILGHHLGHAWARCVDDEERMLRAYRYVFRLARWRFPNMSNQAFLDADIKEQESTCRKRLTRGAAHAAEHGLEGKCCFLGENIAENLEGAWKRYDTSSYFRPKMAKMPSHLRTSLPSRLNVVLSVSTAMCIILSYAGFYLVGIVNRTLAIFQTYLHGVDVTAFGQSQNAQLSATFDDAINVVIALLPRLHLDFMRQLFPYLQSINFALLIQIVSAITDSIEPVIETVGILSVLFGALCMLGTMGVMLHRSRDLLVEIRRGEAARDIARELELGDEYVGGHCVHLAFTFFLATAFFFVLACFAIFIPALIVSNATTALTIGAIVIVEFVISQFFGKVLNAGLHMSFPRLYAAWTVPAAILGVFAGLATLALRVLKYLFAFGVYFSRLDYRLVPTSFITSDTVHERFMGLLIIDAFYNNPVVVTFAGHLVALSEIKILTQTTAAAATTHTANATVAPTMFGFSSSLPHMINMVRVQISVMLNIVNPNHRTQRLDRSVKWLRRVMSLVFLTDDDIAARPADLETRRSFAQLPQFDGRSVRRRCLSRRFWLWWVLLRNPSLKAFRKTRLLSISSGYHYHEEEEDDEHHGGHGGQGKGHHGGKAAAPHRPADAVAHDHAAAAAHGKNSININDRREREHYQRAEAAPSVVHSPSTQTGSGAAHTTATGVAPRIQPFDAHDEVL